MNELALQRFVSRHPPGADVQPAASELVAAYRGVLPDALLELWTQIGLGRYGLLEIINPDEYADVLAGWLMRPQAALDRVPVAISAFGRLFYYRRLQEDAEDIAFLEPHYWQTGVLEWLLEGSFNETLCDEEAITDLLEPELYAECLRLHGPLEAGICTFQSWRSRLAVRGTR
jgi:hypothetical protein